MVFSSPAELKRVRAEAEVGLVKLERDKELLVQKQSQTEQEAQVTLRSALTAQQEETDRLTHEKVRATCMNCLLGNSLQGFESVSLQWID